MRDYIIKFDNDRLGYGNVELRHPAGCGILPGITAVYGTNGSGKTTFGTILEKGRYAFGNRLTFIPGDLKVKMLAFTDIHSLSGMEVTYYHQRMEATMNDYVPTVEETMSKRNLSDGWKDRCEKLGLHNVGTKKINYLSSGELRKLLLAFSLEMNPDLLILDNPYIGLDSESREEFNQSLQALREEGMSVILLLSDSEEIPSFTDSVIELKNRSFGSPITDPGKIEELRHSERMEAEKLDFTLDMIPLFNFNPTSHSTTFAIHKGVISYADRTIIKDLDWEIKAGECWSLQGRNGSGKSLLLSLICADNPQAYANDITLFDRKRGSGESIFEIKDNIGYVSPEMQLYFRSADPVLEIVVQGKRNSLNRYRPTTEGEREEALQWLRLLEIEHLAQHHFSNLSSGEQRLVLLARAFIKQPPLLVLDEPFHGLDRRRKTRLKKIIDALAERNKCSLIFVSHYKEEIPSCVSNNLTIGI